MTGLAPGARVAQLRAAQQRYQADAVLSATPERLVTMLYDRLLLDVERAEAAQLSGNWQDASTHLVHAQAIVAELNASLADTWDGSASLRALYVHLTTTLIGANIGRDPQRTRECRDLIAPLREAWHGAAQAAAPAPVHAHA
jgi:flagellar protein FliS